MGKWRLPIFAAIFVFICVRITMAAFAAPWTWNSDQAVFAWLALCAALTLGVWVTVWLRGGNEAVAVRWKRMRERTAAPIDRRKFWWSVLFWIVIAVALTFIYAMAQR